MKTSYVAAAAVLLAMLASPVLAQSTTTTPAPAAGAAAGAAGTEAPGMKELGVDISKAGTTSQEVQSFVKSLPADRQAKLKQACQTELQAPTASQHPVIATFCKNMQQGM